MNHRAIAVPAAVLLLPWVLLAQRAPDVRINTNPAGGAMSTRPRVVAAGDRVYTVWQDTRSGASDIYFTHSDDRGATWQAADTKLDRGTPAGNSIAPEICAAGSSVYVAWEEYRPTSATNGDVWFNRSLDGGATWLPTDVRLDSDSTPGAAGSRSPKVAGSGSSVFVVWHDQRGSGSYDVWFNRSLDGGTTWLPTDVRLDTGDAPGAATSTNAQVCSQGSNVYVVWTDARTGNDDVWFNRSSDDGTTWLPSAQRIDHAPMTAFSSDPQIACAGNNVYVTWEDDRSGLKDVWFNRSLDGGVTWLPADVRLDRGDPPGGSAAEDPRICCAGSAVFVAWIDGRTFVQQQVFLNRSLDGGATWLAGDVLLHHGTAGCFNFNPAIACSGNLVCVAWESLSCGGAGAADVYCTRSTDVGASWLPVDVRLDTDALGARRSGEPQVAVDGDRCSVVWTDNRNSTVGRSDIYWNMPFGMLPYGAATPGGGALLPRLSGNGAATLGGTMSLVASNGLGGAPGVLLLGGPGSKVAIPIAGGTVLVLPLVTAAIVLGGSPGVPGAGTLTLPFILPASTAYVGANVNFQELFFDPGAPGGLSMTNAVELWIG